MITKVRILITVVLALAFFFNGVVVKRGYTQEDSPTIPLYLPLVMQGGEEGNVGVMGFGFVADPERETVQVEVYESPSITAAAVNETRLLHQTVELGIVSYTFSYQPNNRLLIRATFRNNTPNAAQNIPAEFFLQPFFFTVNPATRNIVSSIEPSVTNQDLGGNGVLEPGETTAVLTFEVIHRNQPLVYVVDANAMVRTNFQAPPVIRITTPTNLSLFNRSPIPVVGTVNDPNATVTVNDVLATVNGNGSFTAQVPLREGRNTVTAVARNAAGAVGTDSIQVSLDSTPPHITIDSPANNAVVNEPTLTVIGMINDVVMGTVNNEQAQVTVNGVAATVANRGFLAANVPLQQGENTIIAVGTDKAGNSSSASIQVFFQPIASEPRIKLVSGNNQSGLINTQLPNPLVVALVDGNGNPAAGYPIVFQVTENDGALSNGITRDRALVAISDANGQAQLLWTLGGRSGAGNNVVEATATGFSGKATFTAIALAGTPAKINVDAGNDQTGEVGKALPNPFVAVVTDAGHNRLANVPVTFTVVQGGGRFFNNQTSFTIFTDSDGRAVTGLVLGSLPGIYNNTVEATFPGNPGFPASFVASGVLPGDPAETQVSGVVLDNSNVPIAGVTLRIPGTNLTTQSDAQGQFVLKPAPVGHIHLVADGSTAQRPGVWPKLEYELVTIAGQNNTVGMPIFLLPLDIPNQLCVDENTGGVLTLPEVPGFSLTVLPGSATFPNGSKQGCVSVTVVHSDKVPMVPNFGQQPRFIVTIQPSGVLFDPVAPLTIPNVDGLAPGAVTEMYSFDHDLGSFVAIGTGTVSEDGAVIQSDPGVGIIKGGWHCGGNPSQTGSVGVCPECRKCENNKCVTDPAKNNSGCNDKDQCTVNDRCQNGVCKGDPIKITSVEGKADGKDKRVAPVNKAINFTATVVQQHCPDLQYEWNFGDGNTSNGQNPAHTYANPGDYTVTVKVKCGSCSKEEKQDTLQVIAFKATIEKPTGDPVTAGSADNEFTYTGAAGVATIPVKAKIEPASAAGDVDDKIKWSLASTPNGSVLSWDSAWPGDPTAGKGVSTNGKLTGYPATNDQFGLRVVRMEVVDEGATASSETANIELFFERDTTATGRTAPNWFFYWNQTGAGDPDGIFSATPGAFGTTPAMLNWSTYAGPRSQITIGNAVTGSDARRDGSGQTITGIDLFANTVVHENGHVQQIQDNNALPFYSGVTGVLRNAAGAGWSFNVGFGNAQWNHFTDTDGNGAFNAGDTDLDTDRDDLGNALELTAAQRALCFSPAQDIECQAELQETSPEDTFMNVDWANPGKQHRTKAHND